MGMVYRAMHEAGHVTGADHRVPVLHARQELTGADRQHAQNYTEGDVIRFSKGSKPLGIEPGEYARVARVDEETNRVTITRKSGEELSYDYGLIIDEPYTKKLKAEFPCWCGSKNCRGTLLAPKSDEKSKKKDKKNGKKDAKKSADKSAKKSEKGEKNEARKESKKKKDKTDKAAKAGKR